MRASELLSDLLGVQQPSKSHLPIRQGSAGQAAVELAAVAGLHLDPWQKFVVIEALGTSEETYFNDVLFTDVNKSSAYEICLILGRQNGKGSIMEALELAWLFLLGQKTIIHSAHEFATSREHFQRIESLISGTPELKAELARGGIKWSHGDESINLRNGQRLLFKTRTKGAARGFSPDKLVMDEAMILKPEAVRAMMYATSARPDAQIMYAGSAGGQDSVHFGRARQRGLRGTDPSLFYAEWSADICDEFCPEKCLEHDKINDPHTWAKANPGMGYRPGLTVRKMESEMLGDPEGFIAERLSVGDWPNDGESWSVIPEEVWKERALSQFRPDRPLVFAVDVTPELNPAKRKACIAVAGGIGDGLVGAEITGNGFRDDILPGTKWVVPRLKEIYRNNRPCVIVIDKATPAAAFVDELEEAGVPMLHPNVREYAEACGTFTGMCVPREGNEPTFVHSNQDVLAKAVAGAAQRKLSELWAWDRANSAVDISPLVAATLAVWGHRKQVTKPRVKAKAAWG